MIHIIPALSLHTEPFEAKQHDGFLDRSSQCLRVLLATAGYVVHVQQTDSRSVGNRQRRVTALTQ